LRDKKSEERMTDRGGWNCALLALAFVLVAPLRDSTAAAAASSAVRAQSWKVAGLNAPADIVIDHWGIAHIFAAGAHDAFFLQGYNAARDRLWQIDLWRKRGLGLLAKTLDLRSCLHRSGPRGATVSLSRRHGQGMP
jgi:penicillin amidase